MQQIYKGLKTNIIGIKLKIPRFSKPNHDERRSPLFIWFGSLLVN